MKQLKTVLPILLTAVLAACGHSETVKTGAAMPSETAVQTVPQTASAEDYALFDEAHSAENALDWAGVYRGELPLGCGAEKCSAAIELLLDGQGGYRWTETAKGKAAPSRVLSGAALWEKGGSVIRLTMPQGKTYRFFVAEGHLQWLNDGGSRYREDNPHRLQQIEAR